MQNVSWVFELGFMYATIDKNIGYHGYIGTSILLIYRKYIGIYFGKKIGSLK